ncbi:MAG: prolipoprotein diacylglyceryl transferase [Clostridia bacterium]|nr:prolipoprotein diacylglyceryl transferase [Clostridia bacterium]
MINISFPGLGIDTFSVDPVAFSIGKLEVRWYGLIITIGILLAVAYCYYRSKQEDITLDDLLDMALFAVPCGVIGARLYYVLTSLSEYDSFGEMIAIWNGGLAIYGAIIAGAITILCVCRYKKINPLKAFDMVSPAVMIGQLLGRWGNFFNGEAYGTEVSKNSILYFLRMGLAPNIKSYSTMYYFHPTFLYESVWNLVGFILINLFYKKKKFDGQIFLMYVSWYGFGRMFIEGLRTDSLYVGVFRISQVLGFLCFLVGASVLIYMLAKIRREKLTNEVAYEAKFPKFKTSATMTADEQSEDDQDDEEFEDEEKFEDDNNEQ